MIVPAVGWLVGYSDESSVGFVIGAALAVGAASACVVSVSSGVMVVVPLGVPSRIWQPLLSLVFPSVS